MLYEATHYAMEDVLRNNKYLYMICHTLNAL